MKDKRYIPNEEFDAIYARVPRLTVEVIIKTPEGVLLTERSMYPQEGKWHLPGGTVYFEEPLTEAVKRVALDELGVHVRIEQQLGYIEYPSMLAAGYKGWPVGIVFLVTIESGEVRGSDQGEKIGYFIEVPSNIVKEQGEFLAAHLFPSRSEKVEE